jgi:hypothetical protein
VDVKGTSVSSGKAKRGRQKVSAAPLHSQQTWPRSTQLDQPCWTLHRVHPSLSSRSGHVMSWAESEPEGWSNRSRLYCVQEDVDEDMEEPPSVKPRPGQLVKEKKKQQKKSAAAPGRKVNE